MARTSLVNLMLSSTSVVALVLLVVAKADDVVISDLVACDAPTQCPRVDPKDKTVHLAYNGDCTKFYKCLEGSKIVMSCPKDENGQRLYFNPCAQTCDWRFNVDCPFEKDLSILGKKSSEIEPYPTECPKDDPKNETIELPYNGDCTKFYSCYRGSKYTMDCPAYNEDGDKLFFNPETHQCDWPENVNCAQSTPLPKQKLPEPRKKAAPLGKKILPVPTQCPAHDSPDYTVHLVYPGDCTKFYKCLQGQQIPMDCPPMGDGSNGKLYFDKYTQTCDWPWNVDCDSNGPTIPPPPPPRPNPYTTPYPKTTRHPVPPPPQPGPDVAGCLGQCPAQDTPNEIVVLPHKECRKWCSCEHGQAKVWWCPGDLHYSIDLKTCTSPEIARCVAINSYKLRDSNNDDEPLMNVLGYNERFLW